MLHRPAYLRCFKGGSKQGKEVPEKGIDFGNYKVVSLEDGGALASMNFKVCPNVRYAVLLVMCTLLASEFHRHVPRALSVHKETAIVLCFLALFRCCQMSYRRALSQFTKTTKHKDDPFKAPYTGKGLETHFTSTGICMCKKTLFVLEEHVYQLLIVWQCKK